MSLKARDLKKGDKVRYVGGEQGTVFEVVEVSLVDIKIKHPETERVVKATPYWMEKV